MHALPTPLAADGRVSLRLTCRAEQLQSPEEDAGGATALWSPAPLLAHWAVRAEAVAAWCLGDGPVARWAQAAGAAREAVLGLLQVRGGAAPGSGAQTAAAVGAADGPTTASGGGALPLLGSWWLTVMGCLEVLAAQSGALLDAVAQELQAYTLVDSEMVLLTLLLVGLALVLLAKRRQRLAHTPIAH